MNGLKGFYRIPSAIIGDIQGHIGKGSGFQKSRSM